VAASTHLIVRVNLEDQAVAVALALAVLWKVGQVLVAKDIPVARQVNLEHMLRQVAAVPDKRAEML
jgi:hypothetical protein